MRDDISKLIHAGNNLELLVRSSGETVEMKTNVEDVLDKDSIKVNAPLYKGRYFPLRTGEEIKVVFHHPVSGVLEFFGKITEREQSGNILNIILKKTSQLNVTQRRRFFRMPILLSSKAKKNDELEVDLTTKNLSAGGMRFVCLNNMTTGEKIEIDLDLKDSSLSLNAEVLQSERLENSMRRFDVRVKFLDVNQREEKKLMQFLLSEQRRMKRLGMI